jgi:predicted O-methyltransferase YrrM
MPKKMIQHIKTHALQNNIPIINDDVADILTHVIQTYQFKNVLEIGTATSYSAHVMAQAGAEVLSIERNKERFDIAQAFVEKSQLKSKIHLIYDDALTYVCPNQTFDLIFIDAAKSQYINFFNKYEQYLHPLGMIIVDNIYFHHLKPSQVKRHTRQLLKKLEKFKVFIQSHEQYVSKIMSYGDGTSISVRNIDRFHDLESKIDNYIKNKRERE